MKTAPRQTSPLRRRAAEAVAQRRERRRAQPRRFAGVWRYFAVIGPGIIVANAGNDAGGVFTYSNTGAKYGNHLLWAFLPILVALIITQEMVARLGTVTGKGLMDLIRERFGVRWTLFAAVVVLIANGGTTLAEFAGVAGGLGLLGVPLPVAVIGAAVLIGVVVMRGNRRIVERIFLALGLTFISYIITAFTVGPAPEGSAIARSASCPDLGHPSSVPTGAYLVDVIALIGTSITPYMQLFLQSSIVDKGTDEKDLRLVRSDVISGSHLRGRRGDVHRHHHLGDAVRALRRVPPWPRGQWASARPSRRPRRWRRWPACTPSSCSPSGWWARHFWPRRCSH